MKFNVGELYKINTTTLLGRIDSWSPPPAQSVLLNNDACVFLECIDINGTTSAVVLTRCGIGWVWWHELEKIFE